MADAERSAWIAALRETDPALADDVASLLREHQLVVDRGFLEHLPAPLSTGSSGQVIGPYALVELIGEGGMGSVWLAKRGDGEIQQRVAIKLLRVAASANWRMRFLRERELLASLSHPAIVRVIDAGHSDGRPYLVMEYVEGTPIDAYAARIGWPDRLRLFLRVCDAVAYAHRRLIIHRDLKPSNVLVDPEGQPKLLDFGIAKLLDEGAEPTQTIERLLTLGYASPEQVRGAAQTTATDIYSLGAVLQKLLTGCAPHESQAVGSVVPSDARYILRKALRIEPEERYASVESFANDVRAILDSRPVEARAGDRWYRTRKFLRRHRMPVAAAALTVISLSAELYVVNRERTAAERRFAQVRQLANRFITLNEHIRGLPGSTQVRTRIAADSLEYLTALGVETGGDIDLELDIALAWTMLAHVQGDPTSANLGQFEPAKDSLLRAEGFAEGVLARNARHPIALARSGAIAHDRMMLAMFMTRPEEAIAQADKAVERFDRFLDLHLDHPTPYETGITYFLVNVADTYAAAGHFEKAFTIVRRGLPMTDEFMPANRRTEGRGGFLYALARARWRSGDLDGALAAASEWTAAAEKIAEHGHNTRDANFADALWLNGLILGGDERPNVGRTADALTAFQRALSIADRHAEVDRDDFLSRHLAAITAYELGNLLRRSDPGRALQVYETGLRRIREAQANPTARREEADLLAGSSYAARALHRDAEAMKRIDAALGIAQHPGAQSPLRVEPWTERHHALQALGDHYAETGQPEKAAATYEKLLAGIEAWGPRTHEDLRDATAMSYGWLRLSGVLHRLSRHDEAASIERRRTDLWEHWHRKAPNNVFVGRQLESLPTP